MNTEKAYRILDAFEVFYDSSMLREAANPEQAAEDAETIRKRYAELKWDVISFSDAARIAKVEFIMRVMEGK